jgi:hypothetical protein
MCVSRIISLEHSSLHVTSRSYSLMQGPGSRYSSCYPHVHTVSTSNFSFACSLRMVGFFCCQFTDFGQEGQWEDYYGSCFSEPGNNIWRGTISLFGCSYLPYLASVLKLSWNGGQVSIAPVPGKRIEHMGVKIELLGQIGMLFAIRPNGCLSGQVCYKLMITLFLQRCLGHTQFNA